MKEFVKRSLQLKIYGEAFKMRFPTVGETREYAKHLKGSEEADATESLLDFLEKLGLPKRVSEDMEADHLAELCEELMPSKKK
jgi:hypothetical protein